MSALSDIDKQLLTLLQKDCRTPNAELAERLGLSASACWRRVRALEESGAITGYHAGVSAEAVGLGFHALVQVELVRHNPQAISTFIQAMSTRPEIIECYATTGQADYQMRVICSGIDAYNRFLDDFLSAQEAVHSAHTNVVLRSVKPAGAVPL